MGSKRKSGFHNEAQDARTELQSLALNYAASRSALLVRSSSCFETTIESCHRQVPIPVLRVRIHSAPPLSLHLQGILRGVRRKSAHVGRNLHRSRHQRQASSSHTANSDRSQTSIRRHQAPQRPRALEVHLTRLRQTLPRGRSAAVDGLGG
jgi:hypothetical protein